MSPLTTIDNYLERNPNANPGVRTVLETYSGFMTHNKLGWFQSAYITIILNASLVKLGYNVQHFNRDIFNDKSAGIMAVVTVGYIGILVQKELEKKSVQ